MSAAIRFRDDFDGTDLRKLAKATKNAAQGRRLLALAEVYDGGARTDAARDWVLRFNSRGPDGLIDGKAPGNPAKLDDDQREALAQIVESGPIPAIHGVVRWRLCDLAAWIWEEFRVSVSETTVSRELRRLGFAKLSARPRHYAQN
ncbi:MAG: helix-turn-helix domain-containing protein, partial [Alphaproteobacteria bacterium]